VDARNCNAVDRSYASCKECEEVCWSETHLEGSMHDVETSVLFDACYSVMSRSKVYSMPNGNFNSYRTWSLIPKDLLKKEDWRYQPATKPFVKG